MVAGLAALARKAGWAGVWAAAVPGLGGGVLGGLAILGPPPFLFCAGEPVTAGSPHGFDAPGPPISTC